MEEAVATMAPADRRRQGALLRRVQLPRLAHRAHGRTVPRHGRAAAHRLPAALQRDVAADRGGAAAGLRALRRRRGGLQPAGARRAQRQVPARRAAAARIRAPRATTAASCRPSSGPNRCSWPSRCRAYAQRKGRTPTQLALGWVWNNRLVHGLIGGPRTLAQWQDYLDALGQPFDAEDEAFISALVPAGHASTPGYTDAQYPVAGRVPAVRLSALKYFAPRRAAIRRFAVMQDKLWLALGACALAAGLRAGPVQQLQGHRLRCLRRHGRGAMRAAAGRADGHHQELRAAELRDGAVRRVARPDLEPVLQAHHRPRPTSRTSTTCSPASAPRRRRSCLVSKLPPPEQRPSAPR